MEFHMINITYAALLMRTQTEKTTFLCKDGCKQTKQTGRIVVLFLFWSPRAWFSVPRRSIFLLTGLCLGEEILEHFPFEKYCLQILRAKEKKTPHNLMMIISVQPLMIHECNSSKVKSIAMNRNLTEVETATSWKYLATEICDGCKMNKKLCRLSPTSEFENM